MSDIVWINGELKDLQMQQFPLTNHWHPYFGYARYVWGLEMGNFYLWCLFVLPSIPKQPFTVGGWIKQKIAKEWRLICLTCGCRDEITCCEEKEFCVSNFVFHWLRSLSRPCLSRAENECLCICILTPTAL